MHYYEIAPNKIVRTNSVSFTYHSEEPLPIGQVVEISIGNKRIVGVVIKQTPKPIYKTKPISKIITKNPIPTQLIELALWIAKYYSTHLAIVLQAILPRGIQKNRRYQSHALDIAKRKRTNIVFSDEQARAMDLLDSQKSGTFLLHGVTGSGKTEIYIDTIKKSLAQNRSALVIVPEIALTSQLISEFSNHFDNILVTHSRMTEASRHLVWLEALNGDRPHVIIGPRSALFTPIKNIGAIIIDEAHEPSLKQEQSPRYSALRAATILGRLHGAKVVLGSATPNIVDYYLASKSNNSVLKLSKPVRKNSKPPIVKIIDSTKRSNFTRHRFVSDQMLKLISNTLDANKQVMVFHNRRGSANVTMCKDCGWSAQCPNCVIPMVLHSDKYIISCHTCGYSQPTLTSCPECNGINIIHKGIGTKLIEAELRNLFPNANIARFDADNDNQEALHSRYKDLYNGDIDIIIGTQIIAKGLDLPNLRTVGIIQADTGLSLPDFSSNERNFQLIAQLVGRVGRSKHQTHVIVQTYQPNHPSIKLGIVQNYDAFYQYVLKERRISNFPPFTYLLKLICTYKTEALSVQNAKKIANNIKEKMGDKAQVLSPTPSLYEQQNNTFRWQIVLKSSKREHLIEALSLVPQNSHWQYELDPSNLL